MRTRDRDEVYDMAVVRGFALSAFVWGAVGMTVGLLAALQLAWPELNLGPWLHFGRIRPVHTNAVIFGFTLGVVFAGSYYGLQRLCRVRMFSDTLSRINLWGWNAIIVAAAISLLLGKTTSKEYAELEWPLDIAITLVWVVYAVNVFGTLARRREKGIYAAIWFWVATVITIAMLHIVNSIELPVTFMKSYSVYAGVHDANIQWWYGHNAVGFLLTTPILGLMYYFLPKQAGRPIFSHRLSILHFWSLIFIYIWAGPHHLIYSPLPDWAQTFGTAFSLMLILPSWGGMLNGLLTLRGAWDQVRTDPLLKMFVVGLTFYGMSTFEGPMMAIKTVNSLSHFTNWTIGHVHSGALGWVALTCFATLYYLVPRLWHTTLWSVRLAEAHFWVATLGIVLYVTPMWVSGVTQGLMWRAVNEDGSLAYSFIESVAAIHVYDVIRAGGGAIFLAGVFLMGWNLWQTVRHGSVAIPEPGPPPGADALPLPAGGGELAMAYEWHRPLETHWLRLTLWTTLAVVVGGLVLLVPPFFLQGTIEPIEGLRPYTALELEGRDLYIREGCNVCHSQMIRPLKAETDRYGPFSVAGESVYDRPFLFGSRRTGPDLARVGGRYPDSWHWLHFQDPRSIEPRSNMPGFGFLQEQELDLSTTARKLRVLRRLGHPYSDAEIAGAEADARAQAARVVESLRRDRIEPGAVGARSEAIALIAYLQRLGTDLPAAAALLPAAREERARLAQGEEGP